jgi:hypothetical protein
MEGIHKESAEGGVGAATGATATGATATGCVTCCRCNLMDSPCQ